MIDKIPLNSSIFIDSNIFIYHFLGISEQCTNFLEKIELGDSEGYTSTVVLAEVLHRLMIAEAVEICGIEPKKAVKYLKQHPELITKLEKCETAINDIIEFNVKILTLTVESIFQSRSLRNEYSLMTNDSLNLQVMKSNGLNDIATNDSDFDRVDWIKVWKP